MPEQIDSEIVKKRFGYLIKVLNEIIEKKNKIYNDKVEKILVEEFDEENKKLTGRNEKNMLVHFESNKNLVGKIVNVKIIDTKPFYLIGQKIGS